MQQNTKIFNNQFLIDKRLAQGAFGVVFQGTDKNSSSQVAIKLEKHEKQSKNSTLDREVYILRRLQGINGVPKLFWSGFENEFNAMVISLHGKDLSYYMKNFKKFSLKTVLLIADQLLDIIKQIHQRNIIHRDLKPENIVVGLKDPHKIYLVDFGISKIFKDTNNKHIPFKDGKSFVGTTRYASVAAHKGYELGRKDDLESIIYILIYFMKGILPWQNLQVKDEKERTKLVGNKKENMKLSEICKDLPQEFETALSHIKKLNFKNDPDYSLIIKQFRNIAQKNEILYDDQLDWSVTEKKDSKDLTYIKTDSKDIYQQQNSGSLLLHASQMNDNKQNQQEYYQIQARYSSLLIPPEKIRSSLSPVDSIKKSSSISSQQFKYNPSLGQVDELDEQKYNKSEKNLKSFQTEEIKLKQPEGGQQIQKSLTQNPSQQSIFGLEAIVDNTLEQNYSKLQQTTLINCLPKFYQYKQAFL